MLGDVTAEGPLDIRPPAIAIIGEVVALRKKLKWFESERELSLTPPLTPMDLEIRDVELQYA